MSQKLLLATFAISFCALVCVVQGSVLGIDLGGEFMKISSISPGKSFVIVENTATRRKTQSAVLFIFFLIFGLSFSSLQIAFHNNERWFEADAVQKRSRALTSTFTFIQKYLGKPYDETLIQKNKEKYFEAYKFEKEEVSFIHLISSLLIQINIARKKGLFNSLLMALESRKMSHYLSLLRNQSLCISSTQKFQLISKLTSLSKMLLSQSLLTTESPKDTLLSTPSNLLD